MAEDREITQDQSYQNLLNDLRGILNKGQEQANKAIDFSKTKIAADIELLLKEGKGDFSFVSQHVPLKIGDETRFIDLVLYHEGRSCYVLLKLKFGRFESRDVGEMNTCLNYYRQHEHKNTTGLIMCREAGREEVHYTLGGLEGDIFVVQYQGEPVEIFKKF